MVIANSYELEGLPATPALAVVTLGEEGAVLLEAGRETARERPPKVDAVDGTAAGAAFAACLVVSRLEDRQWDEALRRSCAAGALAASRPGAQPSLPTAAEIDEILTLRILTLTDEEKRQVAGVDQRARDLLARTESLDGGQLLRLHGAVRSRKEAPGD